MSYWNKDLQNHDYNLSSYLGLPNDKEYENSQSLLHLEDFLLDKNSHLLYQNVHHSENGVNSTRIYQSLQSLESFLLDENSHPDTGVDKVEKKKNDQHQCSIGQNLDTGNNSGMNIVENNKQSDLLHQENFVLDKRYSGYGSSNVETAQFLRNLENYLLDDDEKDEVNNPIISHNQGLSTSILLPPPPPPPPSRSLNEKSFRNNLKAIQQEMPAKTQLLAETPSDISLPSEPQNHHQELLEPLHVNCNEKHGYSMMGQILQSSGMEMCSNNYWGGGYGGGSGGSMSSSWTENTTINAHQVTRGGQDGKLNIIGLSSQDNPRASVQDTFPATTSFPQLSRSCGARNIDDGLASEVYSWNDQSLRNPPLSSLRSTTRNQKRSINMTTTYKNMSETNNPRHYSNVSRLLRSSSQSDSLRSIASNTSSTTDDHRVLHKGMNDAENVQASSRIIFCSSSSSSMAKSHHHDHDHDREWDSSWWRKNDSPINDLYFNQLMHLRQQQSLHNLHNNNNNVKPKRQRKRKFPQGRTTTI